MNHWNIWALGLGNRTNDIVVLRTSLKTSIFSYQSLKSRIASCFATAWEGEKMFDKCKMDFALVRLKTCVAKRTLWAWLPVRLR